MHSFLPCIVQDALARGRALRAVIAHGDADWRRASAEVVGPVVEEVCACLEDLANDPDLGDAAFLADHQRLYQRAARELSVVEDLVGPLFTHAAERDARLSTLVERLAREAGFPMRAPAVTCASNEGYWTFVPFNTIAVPALESEFLLGLPDLAHELAHVLIAHLGDPLAGIAHEVVDPHYRALIADLDSREAPGDRVAVAIAARQRWMAGWLEEVACDAIGLFTVGPAYGWQHLRLSARHDAPLGRGEPVDETHPSDDARMRVLVELLGLMGEQLAADELQTSWTGFVDTQRAGRPILSTLVDPPALIAPLAAGLLDEMSVWDLTDYRDAPEGGVVTTFVEAWNRLRSSPIGYRAWEVEAAAAMMAPRSVVSPTRT